MSAKKLQKALQKMPETGLSGFEGLAKRLLELTLKEPFVLARSGDQPSGDAHNLRRSVCVQAKRYSKASPNAKNIEGDFDECLRALPNTDIYVLAVTRNTAQLNNTLNAMRDKSAVDVVVWDFVDDDSSLAVLCIEYWSQLQDFRELGALETKLSKWILTTRCSPRHKERLAQMERDLRECTQTLAGIREAASSYLRRRFQLAPGTEPLPRHVIHLNTAVARPSYHARALDWWRTGQSRVVVLNAPDGYGKTWVAAQCARAISDDEESIVLWLDSLQWRDCASVDHVLTEAVSCLVTGDVQKVDRLVRKLRERWSGCTLVVLDGVNERNALPAAQKVLKDLILKHRGTCRLLLTTRPLYAARGFEPALWERWAEIKIEPFDDLELDAALTQAGIPAAEVSEQLGPVARIPRYFATCLRLRAGLRRFGNISVALVLWTDLLDKINGLEPAIRESLGFTSESDAVEVLVKLATSLPEAVAKGQAQQLLNQCFGGKYSEVRNYLQEIRIMEQASCFEATLNRDHTTLGRALFLQQVLRTLSGRGIREAADRLLETLEPLGGEDGSAEALFVTLQLSTTQPGASAASLCHQRASLLHAWVFSHNSNASDERLEFWCGYDTDAYAQFLATFFEQCSSGKLQEFVVNPLAQLWRAGGTAATALDPYLRRWLLLVWHDGCSGHNWAHRGHQLPIAQTADQVRLASLAVSFLSLRAEPSFLQDLALCLATEDLTWNQIQNHRSHFKSIHGNVAVLMRWHFTERVLPELERLARERESDELLLDGLCRLARVLRMVQVPAKLRLTPPKPSPYYFGTPAIELIHLGRRVFGCVSTEQYPNERNFSYLAVRDDLPQLHDDDINAICGMIEEISRSDPQHAGVKRIVEDSHLEALWPWYARFQPMGLAKLAGQLQLNALKRGQPQHIQSVFSFLDGVIPMLDDDEMIEWERLANAKACNMKVVNGRLEDFLGLSISEAALLLLPEDAVHRWIVASAEDEGRRFSMCFSPLMDLIPLVVQNETRRVAAERCLMLGNGPFRSGKGAPTELEYWCYIAGLATGPNARLYDWARKRLLQTPEGEERNFSLLRLWLRSAPAGRLEADLESSDEGSLFDNRALRAWAVGGELDFNPKDLLGSYDELMRKLPHDFVGGVLALSSRDADLNRWGKELFAVAVTHLGKPPFERRSRIETHFCLGRDRMVREVGIEDHVQDSYVWSSEANFWGVDSGSQGLNLLDHQSGQKLRDQELDRWRLDEEQIQKWEGYELYTFGALSALEAWSRSHPEEFLPRARMVLAAAGERPATHHHLGGFLHAVICCLLPNDPKEAWQHFMAMNEGQLGVRVQSDYHIPEFYAVLWDLNRCGSPDHDTLRRHLFANCRNEFEVMVLSVASLANHAEDHLMRFGVECLGHELARERALGVSILAWIGSEESASRLAVIATTDASRWLRSHATWATQVSLQEKSSRNFYRRLLHEDDPYKVSGKLQVLKPALTPLARWWHDDIMREEKHAGIVLAPKSAAVLNAFWDHWESTQKSHIEVCGHNLDEFCRGEKLDSLITPKLAPWWKWD